MEWSKKHVTSTLHICWGAQAGLYYHYGIQKYLRESKLSGIYIHKVLHHRVPLMRSMDDYIMAPHSRYTEVRREDVEKHPELIILAESDEAGLFLIMSRDGRQIFVAGPSGIRPYDPWTVSTTGIWARASIHRSRAIIMKMMIQRRNRCYAGEIWPIRFIATG